MTLYSCAKAGGAATMPSVIDCSDLNAFPELTDEDKQGIVDLHNLLRANVTPPATMMMKMVCGCVCVCVCVNACV